MSRKRKVTCICLIVLAVLIKVIGFFPAIVEKYYSGGLYPVIASLQRLLFGWIPFSLGDLLYLAVMLFLVWRLVRSVRMFWRREVPKGWWRRFAGRIVYAALWVYVAFNFLWGLNYDRLGVAGGGVIHHEVRGYTTADLVDLMTVIASEVNELHDWAVASRQSLANFSHLRTGAIGAYDSLAGRDRYRVFAYRQPSVKASLFSWPGVYIGFAGYYNPFTGEAQVNVLDPLLTLPYTTCHEMGHQLGYAKESEANFAGFLAARSSPDPSFQYSVYLDLYMYGARELYLRDSSIMRRFRSDVAPGVREDIRELQRFNRRYANPVEPLIWKVYGRYLRANRQPQGIVTYSEVLAWLIDYMKHFGPDAIRPAPRMIP